jgi:hypothetical protein
VRRLFVLVLVLWPGLAAADEVFLKGGGHLSGEVVEQGPDSILVDIGTGQIGVPLSYVERIVPGPTPAKAEEETGPGLETSDRLEDTWAMAEERRVEREERRAADEEYRSRAETAAQLRIVEARARLAEIEVEHAEAELREAEFERARPSGSFIGGWTPWVTGSFGVHPYPAFSVPVFTSPFSPRFRSAFPPRHHGFTRGSGFGPSPTVIRSLRPAAAPYRASAAPRAWAAPRVSTSRRAPSARSAAPSGRRVSGRSSR